MISKPVSLKVSRVIVVAVAAIFVTSSGVGRASTSTTAPVVVDYTEVTGVLDRASIQYLQRQILESAAKGSSALVLRLDISGGIGVDAGELARSISKAPVPVVAWVAPRGAKALGAGAIIFAAAQVAVVGPASVVGDASSVNAGAARVPQSSILRLLQDVEAAADRAPNDLRGLLSRPGSTGQEALDSGLADYKAASLEELIAGLRGRHVLTASGPRVVLDSPASIRFHKQDLLGRLQHAAIRPLFMFLLLVFGFCIVVFELYNPGIGAGGLVGALALGFSFNALIAMPFRPWALALIGLGFAAYAVDLRRGGFGAPSAAGAALFVVGSLFLLPDGLQIHWLAVAGGVAVTLFFFVSVMTAAIGARAARPLTGAENLVGSKGTARTDISPEGQVFASGTLWRARTLGAAIAQGQQVEILGVKGLVLVVESVSD